MNKKASLIGRLAMATTVLRDKNTPKVAKWLMGASVLYAAMPVDLLPDFLPPVGYLDDVIILMAAGGNLWRRTKSLKKAKSR